MMESARDGIVMYSVSPPSVDYGDGDEELPSAAEGPRAETVGNDAPAPLEPEERAPRRVEVGLEELSELEDYRKNRPFKFLHMYSGPNDPLGQPIYLEATRNRLEVVILSLDNKRDPDLD